MGEDIILEGADLRVGESPAEGWEGDEYIMGVVQGLKIGVQILLCRRRGPRMQK